MASVEIRNRIDVGDAGVEGLIAWQVAAGKAAARNAAGVRVTASVAAVEWSTAGHAVAAPEDAAVVFQASIGKVAAIFALPIARCSSGVGPVA